MATVTKDFRIKSGLVVEGANATVDGSDIITEDIITGGTQTNIAVTYDAQNKVLNFVAENGVADSTTDDLIEGTNNLYFSRDRAQSAISVESNGPLTYSSGVLDLSVSDGLEVSNGELKLPNVNMNYGTFGSTTEIPSITVDSKGRVTQVTTNSISTDLSIAGGSSTTANIELGSETLSFLPGNESPITTQVSNSDNSVRFDISIDQDTLKKESGALKVSIQNGLEIKSGAVRGIGVKAGNGLGVDSNGVYVKYDGDPNDSNYGTNTLELDSNGLLRVRRGDYIRTDSFADGISVDAPSLAARLSGESLGTKTGIERVPDPAAPYGSSQIKVKAGNGLEINEMTGELQVSSEVVTYTDGITSNLSANNNKITDLATPTNPNDAATKNYVDSIAAGLTWKAAVNLLSTSDVPLNGNTQTVVIDGHSALDSTDVGYRLLLIGQAIAEENGIYVYSDNGGTYTLSRATDLDTIDELDGAAVFVMEGIQYGSTSWVQANHYAAAFADQEWDQFSGAGTYLAGYGLTLTGNTFAVDAAEIASQTDLGNAVDDLTAYVDGFLNSNDGTTIQYIDDQDAATLASANAYTDTAIQTGDATATPTYLAIDYNSVATQVAASATVSGTGSPEVIYSFDSGDFRSAKFLVKMQTGTHTQVSEVLVTLDSLDNIAITEYAIVGTNGNLGDVSASENAGAIELTVTTSNTLGVVVAGTLLV